MNTIKTTSKGLILLFSLISCIAQGQVREQKELIREIDSLYRVIYTFNYSDTTTFDTAFVSFESKIDSLVAEGVTSGHKGAVYKAKNVLFIHLKYKDDKEATRTLLDETIAYAEAQGDTVANAQFTYLVGNYFSRYNEYDSALVYFENALTIAESVDNKSAMAAAINALAVTYANIGRDDLALDYYYESLDIAKFSKDSTQVLTSYGNLATVYGRIGNADSTMHYANIAYDLSQVFDEPAIKWHALNSLSVGSFLKGKYNDAIKYADILTRQVTPIEEFGFLITSDLYRSKSLYAMGNERGAYRYAQSSLSRARSYEIKTAEIRALEWLVELTELSSMFKNAYDYHITLTTLRDSLNDIETNKRIDAMAARYETRQREQEIASMRLLQEQEDEKKRLWQYIFISTIILLGMAIVLIYNFQKRKVEKERLAQQKAKNELLRTQMNPHFLFNALSSIQLFMINKGQGVNALEYLSKFAKLMRRILENSRKDVVSLEDEMSTLRHYLDLQKIRFDNRFEYKLNAELEYGMHESEIMIPPMFAQPFIENSLEHGIVDKDDGLIEIYFKQSGDKLQFMVSDNGIGVSRSMSAKQNLGHESMATKITNDRIELLKKQKKKNITFNIRDRINEAKEIIGTQVTFELPLEFRV